MTESYIPPIARLPENRIRNQASEIERARETSRIQHGQNDLVMVVNEARQIVYASPGLVSIFSDSPDEGTSGKRFGELLGCVYAGIDQCGHTENCEFCGAAQAILDAQAGSTGGSRECVIQTGGDGRSTAYNFNIRTLSLEMKSDRFVMLLLDDIGSEKHRAALERIFFHDILNTVTGLRSYVDLLKRQVDSEPNRELVARIGEITGMLVEEIRSQKLLTTAESGTLRAARQFIVSRDVVESIMVQYSDHDLAVDKKLIVEPFGESVSFVSDETILRRVIGNMVKNALEASAPGDTVALGSRQQGADVVFSVRNAGVIPRDIQFQIFNRFFSTKGTGRGLGTYGMKLLAEGYLGGRVWFSSDHRNGTVFNVSVPLEAEAEG